MMIVRAYTHIVTDRPVGFQITAFIGTTVKTMETVTTREFQESLTRENPALVLAVLLAHSPTYNLLNSVDY